jgi:hypothetical protein
MLLTYLMAWVTIYGSYQNLTASAWQIVGESADGSRSENITMTILCLEQQERKAAATTTTIEEEELDDSDGSSRVVRLFDKICLPWLVELEKKCRAAIEDKYGVTKALLDYGPSSVEYQTAREEARDELHAVMQETRKAESDINVYARRQRQAQMQLNIVNGHLTEMEDDPHIGPLLKPIELQGGKQTSLVAEELNMLRPVLEAAFRGEILEKMDSSSPLPSKGMIPQGSTIAPNRDVRDLQDYVREHDPDNM